MSSTETTLSLIIPALNESSIIKNNIDELAAWMDHNLPDVSFEIIVIDDGSTDGMGNILDEARGNRGWLKVAHHSRNMGRGRGVRTGFECSQGKYIICIDADLSYSPEHISILLEPLIKGDADITLASAHHPEGKIINVPRQREFLSKWGNWILGKGFSGKFYTVTCIVRGFTRDVVDSLELVNDGKELHLEIIQKSQLMGYRIKEIPATLEWRDRRRGQIKKNRIIPEIAIFKMRKTVLSHLVFNYITNPGILLLIPILSLLSIILIGAGMLVNSFIGKLLGDGETLYHALRQTLIDGQLTVTVVFFAFITLMVFIVFYFLSSQSKRYFDETYTLMMRINKRIKSIEKDKNIIR